MGTITYNIISGQEPFTAVLTPPIGSPYIETGLSLGVNTFEGIPEGSNYTLTVADSRGCTWVIEDIDFFYMSCSDTNVFQYAHSSIVVNNVMFLGERKASPYVVRFPNPDDLSVYTRQAIPGVGSAGQGLESVCYSSSTEKIYFGARDSATGYLAIVEVDPDDVSVYTVHIITSPSPIIADLFVITTDGTYIYGGTDELFFKIRISDWEVIQTSNFVASGFTDSHGAAISIDRGLFYVSSQYGVSKLAIVSMTDISSYTIVDLSAHVSHPTDDICVYDDGDVCKVYVAGEWSYVGNGAASVEITNGNLVEGIELLPSYGLWEHCGIIYSAAISNRIQSFNINDPSSITTIYIEAGFIPNELLIVNNRMFATHWGGLGSAKLCEVYCVDVVCNTTTTTSSTSSTTTTSTSSSTTTTTTTCEPQCYGLLYNWYVVDTGKLAPTGWHVPTDAEWTTLSTYLGGDTVAGGKMKTIGTCDWLSPNTGATNSSGFSALPGGTRYNNGQFSGFYSLLWTSSEYLSTQAYLRILSPYLSNLLSNNYEKTWGLSIRCLLDGVNPADPGSVTDIDGNIYSTVKIGTQVWMAENLKTTHYNDGELIPEVTDNTDWSNLVTGALCAYNNDWNNVCGERPTTTTTTTTCYQLVGCGIYDIYNPTDEFKQVNWKYCYEESWRGVITLPPHTTYSPEECRAFEAEGCDLIFTLSEECIPTTTTTSTTEDCSMDGYIICDYTTTTTTTEDPCNNCQDTTINIYTGLELTLYPICVGLDTGTVLFNVTLGSTIINFYVIYDGITVISESGITGSQSFFFNKDNSSPNIAYITTEVISGTTYTIETICPTTYLNYYADVYLCGDCVNKIGNDREFVATEPLNIGDFYHLDFFGIHEIWEIKGIGGSGSVGVLTFEASYNSCEEASASVCPTTTTTTTSPEAYKYLVTPFWLCDNPDIEAVRCEVCQYLEAPVYIYNKYPLTIGKYYVNGWYSTPDNQLVDRIDSFVEYTSNPTTFVLDSEKLDSCEDSQCTTTTTTTTIVSPTTTTTTILITTTTSTTQCLYQPVVQTVNFPDRTSTSIQVNTNVGYVEGICDIIERGLCWSEVNPNPTKLDNFMIISSNFGSITEWIINLAPSTGYYIGSYCESNMGTHWLHHPSKYYTLS